MLAKYVEPMLYNIYGDAVLDFFTPDRYNNALDAEWDENECQVIPEDERMACDATSSNEHDWLIDQNLDDLLGGNQAETVERHPK